MPATPVPWRLDPLQAMARWPADAPLAAFVSGDQGHWSRWSVLALPGAWEALPASSSRHAAIAWLHDRSDRHRRAAALPGDGGWILQFGYELGSALEPATGAVARGAHPWPLAQAAPILAAIVHDAATDRWFRVGGRHPLWDRVEAAMSEPPPPVAFTMGPPQPDSSDMHYAELVSRTVELIRSGDLFQANVARRWKAAGHGAPRAFALAALGASHARYGAWLETPAGLVASMSPELFLQLHPDGTVITRPIKGTRPAGSDTSAFLDSEKDAAELHMIVDLMRNDLARACEPGSVRVRSARAAEPHATVLHGVAEVQGRLRHDLGPADLVAATFPPGSVTGAPKVRAMQVIRELECFDRGPYCGAIGLLGADGSLSLNVAIRTAMLRPAAPGGWDITYAAGCGIVSDSEPMEEVRETHAKVAVLQRAADLMRAAVAVPAPAAPAA